MPIHRHARTPYDAARTADILRRVGSRPEIPRAATVPLGILKRGRLFTVIPGDEPGAVVFRVVAQGKAITDVIATNTRNPREFAMLAGRAVYVAVEKEGKGEA